MASSRRRRRNGRRERREGEFLHRVREARKKCGCETLFGLILFGQQIGRVPKSCNIAEEVEEIHRNNNVSSHVVAFVKEVNESTGNFFANLWRASHTSGRVTA